jgi:pyrroloquinoline-quinone synthase
MTPRAIQQALSEAVRGVRLLEHPFYRRWVAGELEEAELASYAGQYRHFEARLPRFLTELVEMLPDGHPRDLVSENLAEELGDPVPHIELFDDFAAAVGAPSATASRAMQLLLDSYDAALDEGPVAALAGLVAYEHQAPEVASTKAAGLRAHFGLSGKAVQFWDHHAAVDLKHAEWGAQALCDMEVDAAHVERSARSVAQAWWCFLDERELVGPRRVAS